MCIFLVRATYTKSEPANAERRGGISKRSDGQKYVSVRSQAIRYLNVRNKLRGLQGKKIFFREIENEFILSCFLMFLMITIGQEDMHFKLFESVSGSVYL